MEGICDSGVYVFAFREIKCHPICTSEVIGTLVALFSDGRLFSAGHVCVPAGCQGMPGSDRQAISEQVAPS